MKASKKEMIASVALCLLPIILGVILWNKLPDRVPTHFGLNNEADGYSAKWFAVFGLPCVMAGIDLILLFGLRSDPKADRHSKVLARIMLWFVPLISCIVTPMCLLAGIGKRPNVALLVQLLIGIIFIVVGNYLPKCRQNYTMGIKLPWTLHDEDNWNFTHRLGGFVWVIGGFLMLLNAFFGRVWMLFTVIVIAVLVPMIASYVYYRKHKKSE